MSFIRYVLGKDLAEDFNEGTWGRVCCGQAEQKRPMAAEAIAVERLEQFGWLWCRDLESIEWFCWQKIREHRTVFLSGE